MEAGHLFTSVAEIGFPQFLKPMKNGIGIDLAKNALPDLLYLILNLAINLTLNRGESSDMDQHG
jgi:hypothetical protein